jgi:hypothetical protein
MGVERGGGALAPRLQPDVTAHDTTRAQPRGMGDEDGDREPGRAEEDSARPDLTTRNLAGWIFRDGDCVAIERRGDEPDRRARVLAD